MFNQCSEPASVDGKREYTGEESERETQKRRTDGRRSWGIPAQERNTGRGRISLRRGTARMRESSNVQRWKLEHCTDCAGRLMCRSVATEWAPPPLPRRSIHSLSVFPSFLTLSFLTLSLKLSSSAVFHHATATVRRSHSSA